VLCCVLLACRYPAFAGGLLSNWQLVEGMKEGFCYSAQDYGGLLQKALAEPSTAGEGFLLLLSFDREDSASSCSIGSSSSS
jgi:hypothetical protein